jgi:hypothetical protein
MYLPSKSPAISQQGRRQTMDFNNYQQAVRSSHPSNHSATLYLQYQDIIPDQIQISLIDYSGLTSGVFFCYLERKPMHRSLTALTLIEWFRLLTVTSVLNRLKE